jgi:acyl-CoA dehydrogenase
MEFGFTQQQEELREVARRFLTTRYPPERVATVADSSTGYAEDGWDPIVQLGWLDAGLNTGDLALLADESGYALHPVPWWSTVGLVAPAYAGTRSPPQAPATFAWSDELSGSLSHAHCAAACRAVALPDSSWRVSGTKRLVPDLAGATEVVLTATSDGGVALFRVVPTDPAVTITPRASLDGLRRIAELHCADAPAQLVTTPAATPEALRRIRWRVLTLLAAEAVGVARRAFELAAEHAKVRIQFGRPIGSYQGVSFRIADSYVAIELAHSLAYRAAWLVDHAEKPGGTDVANSVHNVDDAVACAIIAGRDAAISACEHALQVLGGIAMTWQHPVHRWYRRALWLQAFDMRSAEHREDLARALLGT